MQTAGPSSTLNLQSLRVTVPEIWPGQNRGGQKKEKKKKRKKNECEQSHIASPTGITNNIKKNSFDFSISKSTLWSRAENKRDRFSLSPENEKLYANYAAAFQL